MQSQRLDVSVCAWHTSAWLFRAADMDAPTTTTPTASPERTVVAGQARRVFDLPEIWRYRDLLYFLTRRQVLSRYKQTFLGIAWAVLQPVLTMVVFSIVLGRLARVGSEGIPYPVFAYLGILPWQYFSGSVQRSTTSLATNAHLITKVYFPRVLLPVSASLSALVDFAVALVVLLVLMAWYGMAPSVSILLVIPLVLLAGAIATGIGLGLGALNVRYRDVSHAMPLVLQLWMFLTPVVYPVGLVPDRWRWLLGLNPATGIVESTRAAVLGRPLDLVTLGTSIAVGIALTVVGAWLFRRTERTFADLV